MVSDQSVFLQDAATAFPTFDLTGMPLGTYTVQATADDGTTTQLAQPLTVVPATSANVQEQLTVPSATLPNSVGEVTVDYVNQGNTDVPAPLLELAADNALLRLEDQTDFFNDYVWFLGVSSNGPAGVLRQVKPGS